MTLRLRDFCRGNPDVKAWMREHGLDPRRVAMAGTLWPVIDGDQMTVFLYLEDTEGQRHLDPATGEVAHEVRTVTITRPVPDLVTTSGRRFPVTEAA